MSGSLGGVRIVDMPGLGTVTDDSSMVGEHAGSGRFGAPAIRTYVWANSIANVLNFGADPSGATDSTAAIIAAVASLSTAGGSVYVPKGTYLVHSTIYLRSNTRFYGDGPQSVLKAAAAWTGATPDGVDNPNLAFLQNVNSLLPASFPWAYTDHDITIEKLKFDYTGMSMVNATSKCVTMIAAQNVVVQDCVFNVVGGQNATAMIACDNTVVDRCRAYEFRNCGYDHWWGPSRGVVSDCFLSTSTSGQMVNWNTDATSGVPSGLLAKGFILRGCQFHATGAAAVPIQIEPLSTGTVADVTVQGNTFSNVRLTIRGAVSGAIVAGNIFDAPLGGGEAITSYPMAGSPINLSIVGNLVINPATTGGNVAVIRIETSSALIANNAVIGAAVNAIDTGSYTPVVIGNYGGVNSGGPPQTNRMQFSAGINFTTAAASVGDLSMHINLNPASGNEGFNFYGGNVNYGVGGGSHVFYAGGALVGLINAGGAAFLEVVTGGAGGPSWTQGLGVPSANTPRGSLYSRVGGDVGTTLYISQGASIWIPVPGV